MTTKVLISAFGSRYHLRSYHVRLIFIQEMLPGNLVLLTRKQNDTKAVSELDSNLREMDSNDPVKYDFALFGLGVFEDFK